LCPVCRNCPPTGELSESDRQRLTAAGAAEVSTTT
jgi:hypothetical protein